MPHRLKHEQVEQILGYQPTGLEQAEACTVLKHIGHPVTDVELIRMAASALVLLGAEDELLAGNNEHERADNLWRVAHNLLRNKHRRENK